MRTDLSEGQNANGNKRIPPKFGVVPPTWRKRHGAAAAMAWLIVTFSVISNKNCNVGVAAGLGFRQTPNDWHGGS